MSRLISLETWLQATYGEDAPSINTARRWCREDRIFPIPQKHGRSYFVEPDAQYTEPSQPVRLVDRINGAKTT